MVVVRGIGGISGIEGVFTLTNIAYAKQSPGATPSDLPGFVMRETVRLQCSWVR